jgi:hypothetical protein
MTLVAEVFIAKTLSEVRFFRSDEVDMVSEPEEENPQKEWNVPEGDGFPDEYEDNAKNHGIPDIAIDTYYHEMLWWVPR